MTFMMKNSHALVHPAGLKSFLGTLRREEIQEKCAEEERAISVLS
jgi:hypothetical protein